MNRRAPTVADIFRRYGDTYRADASLSTAQRRVMTALARCRTAALGGHVEQCDRAQRQFFSVDTVTKLTPMPRSSSSSVTL